jgi:hypothetical protein
MNYRLMWNTLKAKALRDNAMGILDEMERLEKLNK